MATTDIYPATSRPMARIGNATHVRFPHWVVLTLTVSAIATVLHWNTMVAPLYERATPSQASLWSAGFYAPGLWFGCALAVHIGTWRRLLNLVFASLVATTAGLVAMQLPIKWNLDLAAYGLQWLVSVPVAILYVIIPLGLFRHLLRSFGWEVCLWGVWPLVTQAVMCWLFLIPFAILGFLVFVWTKPLNLEFAADYGLTLLIVLPVQLYFGWVLLFFGEPRPEPALDSKRPAWRRALDRQLTDGWLPKMIVLAAVANLLRPLV